jgi:predicted chitinase
MKLKLLPKITEPALLASLDKDSLKELQLALLQLGYPVRTVDGLIGARTATAWAEFKTDVFQGNPDLVGPGAIDKLQEALDELAAKSKYDLKTPAGTIKAIKAECIAQGIGLPAQIAYVLATVEHETAKKFLPVKESFYLGEVAGEKHRKTLRYYPYYGRGYVQLTWKYNYAKYGQILNKDLVGNPDLALDAEVSLFVLVHGFKTGAFTGRKLADYVNANEADFINARRCINGTDKALAIKALALKYLATLNT